MITWNAFFLVLLDALFVVVVVVLALAAAQLLPVALETVEPVLEGVALATLDAGVQDKTAVL